MSTAGSGHTATERPTQALPFSVRLLLFVAGSVGAIEFILYTTEAPGPGRFFRRLLAPILVHYLPVREWASRHPILTALGAVTAAALLLAVNRWLLILWHNEIVSRLSGTKFKPADPRFPMLAVDIFEAIRRRPAGHSFVGLKPVRGLLGWRGRPVYISQRQKTMHCHVLGKTGSGKTQGVLWPGILQDVLDGKGVVFLSGKGSDEDIRAMKAIAGLAGRHKELRVMALPAWNQPRLFTHTYNMIYVRPASPGDEGGDPVATAERVFSVLPLGDNDYYNTQAQVMFTNLCRLLHGMRDERGHGLPFVVQDLLVCLRGIGSTGAWADALHHCLRRSTHRDAALAITAQIRQLGRDVNRCFSGLVGALEKFTAPMVNAYEPDIIFEEILEKNLLVYVQLPANLFRVQAPALGRLVLTDIQQEGSLRQVHRSFRNQRPCAVVIDEFYNFADLYIVDSLNKLRDANLEYTLAHQSLADLELVSKEFAQAVWDNTRTKHILNQDNPALCDLIARSIGTEQVLERTVRMEQGSLFTSLMTGDASSKLVEAFKLPPNAIKSLARYGQGYVVNDEGVEPVCYGVLPNLEADYQLPRRDQKTARGLRLYARFVAGTDDLDRPAQPLRPAEPAGAAPSPHRPR